MKQSKFTIDSLPHLEFEGYTNGDDWNGWACPYFSIEEAHRIAKAHASSNVQYDEENDQFIFNVGGEEEFYPSVSENGKKLYPIGSGSWIWEESE